MAVRLAKYFKRREDWDFSDDGNYFRCYEYRGIRISLCKSYDGYYIEGRSSDNLIDFDLKNYDLEYLKICDKVLGVLDRYNDGSEESQIDLETWVKDLDSALELLQATQKPKPVIYLSSLDNKYYGFRFEKRYYSQDYEKKLSQIYINESNINKYEIKKLVVA